MQVIENQPADVGRGTNGHVRRAGAVANTFHGKHARLPVVTRRAKLPQCTVGLPPSLGTPGFNRMLAMMSEGLASHLSSNGPTGATVPALAHCRECGTGSTGQR